MSAVRLIYDSGHGVKAYVLIVEENAVTYCRNATSLNAVRVSYTNNYNSR